MSTSGEDIPGSLIGANNTLTQAGLAWSATLGWFPIAPFLPSTSDEAIQDIMEKAKQLDLPKP
jgi:hypothetical protein